jgi:hypothetical protein
MESAAKEANGMDAVHNFIVTLEAKAKRILKAAHVKKKHEDKLAEKKKENAVIKAKLGKSLPQTGTVLLASPLKERPRASPFKGKEKLAKSLDGPMPSTLAYSVPKMFVSLSQSRGLTEGKGGDDGTMGITSSSTGQLSPIKNISRRAQPSDASNGLRSKSAEGLKQITNRRNMTLEKLDQSPLIGSMNMSIEEMLAARKHKLAASSASSAPKESSNWDLARQASTVLGDGPKGSLKKRNSKAADQSKSRGEPQGPIDWSSRGLRSKYRGETEREDIWNTWIAANSFSSKALEENDLVLPIAKIERHPLYVLFEKYIAEENFRSLTRTKSRLLMKRFVMDVHEIWLTNLQHLREHQPALILAEMDAPETTEQRGQGIKQRRDIAAINELKSQIPSVSQRRAMERAFYTTPMRSPTVVLDYERLSTPKLEKPKPIPPFLENYLSQEEISYRKGVLPLFLYIDRLVPSIDSRVREVLWRLRAVNREQIVIKDHYIRDVELSAYLDNLALYENHNVVHTAIVHTKDSFIPWSYMDLASKNTVTVTLETCGRIKIIISAQLDGAFGNKSLELNFYGAEILKLFSFPVYFEFVEDFRWWLDDDRSTLWETVVSNLFVAEGDVDDSGDPSPQRLNVKREKSPSDHIDGASTVGMAQVYALEILKYMKISSPVPEKILFSWHYPGSVMDENLREPVPLMDVSEDWEDFADEVESLSLRVNGGMALTTQVPGALSYGHTKGIWLKYALAHECTHVAALFFRNPRLSTTDTVLVNLTLSLDTPILFTPLLAWGEGVEYPHRMPAEEEEAVIPMLIAHATSLLSTPLVSPIHERLSFVATIFNKAPVEGIDHPPLDSPTLPEGMCRHWPFRNRYGFRRKLVVHLLLPEVLLPTIVFGITRAAAQANVPAVNARNIWHSSLAITEHINRPRASKDYHYVVKNIISCGANDPHAFSVQMRGGEFFNYLPLALKSFEEDYENIKARKERAARHLALDAKIENSEVALKVKEKTMEAAIRRELQFKLEKKLKKASRSEQGWRQRFKMSTLLEVQGNWERRRYERTGAIFFRSIPRTEYDGSHARGKESYLQTCQWDVPATWDGDPLDDVAESDMYSRSTITGFPTVSNSTISLGDKSRDVGAGQPSIGEADAFKEPAELWTPEDDYSVESTTTPGVRTQGREGASIEDGVNSSVEGMKSWVPGSSLGVSTSVGPTINTQNLEHIAEQLVSSDELVRILARRLGISEDHLVPAHEIESLFAVDEQSRGSGGMKRFSTSVTGAGSPGKPPDAPRNKHTSEEFDIGDNSDEDQWSDEEDQAGDYNDMDVGDLPQSHTEVFANKNKANEENRDGDITIPSQVPFLNLAAKGLSGGATKNDNSAWRRLARPDIGATFATKCKTRLTMTAEEGNGINEVNQPTYLLPISPVDACDYRPENFVSNVESIFISDAKKDMERAIATVARNIRREEELARNIPTDDLLLFGEAKELTNVDSFLTSQYKEDQDAFVDPREAAIDKAILAAKSNNIAIMEDALEEDIPINCADQFGNSLLLLAAQQGSKRMCKFLLRRGADINAQNLGGCTVLHYCYTYSHSSLAEYLKSRGADDSIVNLDGLTCYEGLDAEALEV